LSLVIKKQSYLVFPSTGRDRVL